MGGASWRENIWQMVRSYGAIEAVPDAGAPMVRRRSRATMLVAMAVMAVALAAVVAVTRPGVAAPATGRTVLWGKFLSKISDAWHNMKRKADEAKAHFQQKKRDEAAAQKAAADALAAQKAAEAEARRKEKEAQAAAAAEARQREKEAKMQAAAAAAAQRLAEQEALRAEAAAKAAAAAAEAHEKLYRLNAFGTDVEPHEWAHHGSDWIYQEGPETDSVKHDVYYNQWEDLDDSPIGWHITEEVDPATADTWLTNVGRGIY